MAKCSLPVSCSDDWYGDRKYMYMASGLLKQSGKRQQKMRKVKSDDGTISSKFANRHQLAALDPIGAGACDYGNTGLSSKSSPAKWK